MFAVRVYGKHFSHIYKDIGVDIMKKRNVLALVLITFILSSCLTSLFIASEHGTTLYCKLSDKIGGMKNTKLLKLEQIIGATYMGEMNGDWMTNRAATEYVATVRDKYTSYLDETQYKSIKESLGGEYRGIGIHIKTVDGKILIESVKEDSPAEKAGIRGGDYLISLDSVPCSAENVGYVTTTIKGLKVGETITVGVERDLIIYEKKIKIEEIKIEQVLYRMLEDNIGYIRIETFGTDADEKFKNALSALKEKKAKSLVIDLRSNPGGSLDSVVEIADYLLGETTILTVKYKGGEEDVYKSDKKEEKLPICVLVNSESASASEVLASSLKENGKAVLIGEKTFGKGVVQGIFDLGDDTGVRVTIARYYTSKGNDIDGVGVEPDIYLPLTDGVEIENYTETNPQDNQLLKAIEILKQK